MTWLALNLASSEYAVDPEPPHVDYSGLFYLGKRHVVSAPTESLKTLLVMALMLDAIRAGRRIGLLDFEMGPHAMRRLLRDLGASDDELGAVYYVEPEGPPERADIEAVVADGVDIMVIDASMGAFHASGLDDNKRQDVERFASQWITPLWQAGIATVTLDHVTKNAEGRGRYAIGSERKVGGVDVHLGLEVVGTTLTRGGLGLVKVHVHKDRFGYLPRPYAAEVALVSSPDSHRITWEIRPSVAAAGGDEWKPTVLMERVSRYLENHPEGANRTAIYRDVKGKRDWLVVSVDFLLQGGYVAESVPGEHGTAIRLLKPFREDPSPPSPPVPGRPRDGSEHPSPPSPPPQGGTGTGDGSSEDDEEVSEEVSRLEAIGAELQAAGDIP